MFIKIYTPTAMSIARKMPISIFEPGKSLSSPSLGVDTPLAVVGSVYAVFPPAVLINWLLFLNTQLTIFAAIQLVMMQTMTSLTLRNALNILGISPHIIPQRVPTTRARTQTKKAVCGVVGTESATMIEPIAPIRYCPGAPMLKRPVLNAIATERPVRSSGATSNSISPNTNATFLIPPLAKGPARIIRIPLNASDTGTLSDVSANMRSTSHPTNIPATIQSNDDMTDFVPSLL